MSEPTTDKQPFKFTLSDNVRGFYGYKDGHTELEVDLPPPLNLIKKTFRTSFNRDEVERLKEGIDQALAWAKLPDFQRERDGS